MARHTVVAILLFAALGAEAARKKAAPVKDPSCVVTASYPDGREEARDCYSLSDAEMAPG